VGADAIARLLIESGRTAVKNVDISVNQCGLRGTLRIKNVSTSVVEPLPEREFVIAVF
jgi:hypothetical protein